MSKKILDIIKNYYKLKIYKNEDVAAFVKSNDITPEEYKEITGEEYVK